MTYGPDAKPAPTATHDVADVHETPEKDSGAGPLPNVVTGCQVPPERVSANPEEREPVTLPTATHENAVTHETAVKSYNQNLWMHHLNGDAAYLPV